MRTAFLCSEAQQRRLEAFEITARDIAVLARYRDLVVAAIPALNARLDHDRALRFPAIAHPVLLQRRNSYWSFVARGQLDDSFVEAAYAFAAMAFDHKIPSAAFTLRHSAGSRAVVEWLFGPDSMPPGRSWVRNAITRILRARRRAEYAGALQKALWLGLGLALEGYATAQAKQKLMTLDVIERGFSAGISGVADMLADQVVKLEAAVVSISGFTKRSTHSSEVIAGDALNASQAGRRIAESARELALAVDEIGRRTNECAQSAADAAGQARLGDNAVASFSASTYGIKDLIDFINRVASRTKLLALNATIEAARAGAVGRGFAVVAGEVRALAIETSVATDQITQQVNVIQGSMGETTAAIHALTERIEEVSEITSLIAHSLVSQAMATQAIAVAAQQAARGNDHVSQLTAALNHDSGQRLALAARLRRAATGIGLQSATVLEIKETFMGEVRAAQGGANMAAQTAGPSHLEIPLPKQIVAFG